MSLTLFNTLLLFVCLPFAAAHISLWDPSMFGRCGSNNQCVNQAEPTKPLQLLKFDEWWWHHYLAFPPAHDAVMSLPAGKNVTVQLASNSAFTSLGQYPQAFWPGGASRKAKDESVENNSIYWTTGGAGNLHTTGHRDVAGCGLSIAYTSIAKDVRPEDMTIFSVQHDCAWHRDAKFEIPADMPPCPDGKCMCSWWWIHNSDGGTDQMYQTAFQCNITYAPDQKISTTPVGRPVPPVKCEHNAAACVKGPKMPMYWKQLECNNMYEPGHQAPTYGKKYGFTNGAQNDIFQTITHSNWTCPQSHAVGVFPRDDNRTSLVPRGHRQTKRHLP